MFCLARGVSLLSIETIKRPFFREKERGQGRGRGRGNASQGRARQAKARAGQTLFVSCFALPGESLLSIETIKRLFSFREKERGQGKAGAGARQVRGRGKASLVCVMFSLAPGASPLYRNI